MAEDIKQYRVFIASPGGLDKEREGFRDTLRDYNEMDAVQRGVLFRPVGWEDTLGGIGRPQSIINDDVRSCDYFVMVLWDRWGSSPDKKGKGKYSSGTEEEYHIALECFADKKMPMRQIVVFFKAVDERMLSDPGPQLNKVLDFKRKLETEKTIYFHTYDEIEHFKKLIGKYLAQWVRDHESGEAGKPVKQPIPPQGPPVGAEEVSLVEPEILPGEREAMSAKIRDAWRLADEGKLTDAEIRFAELAVSGTDVDVLNNYGRFLLRIGRLGQAEVMHKKVLEVEERTASQEGVAAAYGNLGLIYRRRGDLDKAEKMHIKALDISEKLGQSERMARQYASLGVIYRMRGDLEKAEQMHTKALEIDEKFGQFEGMASDYGSLGIIYRTRGDLVKAEQMYSKALEIDEKHGLLEGMASAYGNLGLIYSHRGDPHKAEQMYIKAIEIDEKLGWLEGMAHHYGNLGTIYDTSGDIDRAERIYKKVIDIAYKLELRETLAASYNNLGNIYLNKGDLDIAEQMVLKALWISDAAGMIGLEASQYANLGIIYRIRGDSGRAKEYWEKALELFERIGMKPEIEKTQRLIDELKEK